MADLTIHEAAAATVALINASPRTPSVSEIVSVIARVVPASLPMTPVPASTLAAFEEYRRLARKWIHAEEKGWRTVPRNNSAVEAAEAAHDELSACLERIWATAPRGWADVVLLALIYANTTDEIGDGVWLYLDPKRDGDGTNPCNDARARAFLLDAIFQTAGVRLPHLPRQIESQHIPVDFGQHLAVMQFPSTPTAPSQLTLALRRLRPVLDAAISEELDAEKTPAYEAACAKSRRLDQEFAGLCRQVWERPVDNCNRDDLAMRCEAALAYVGRNADGSICGLNSECLGERSLAELLLAVAAFAGCGLTP